MDIKPIPYYYEFINRNAILVKPKKPFFDWFNKLFKDDRLLSDLSDLDENNIYLIRDMDNIEDVKKWIKKNFDKIFDNELNDW